jgi:hypothetical protein
VHVYYDLNSDEKVRSWPKIYSSLAFLELRFREAQVHNLIPTNNRRNQNGALSHLYSKRPWNKGKLTGKKAPPKLKEIWALRSKMRWEWLSKQKSSHKSPCDALRGVSGLPKLALENASRSQFSANNARPATNRYCVIR